MITERTNAVCRKRKIKRKQSKCMSPIKMYGKLHCAFVHRAHAGQNIYSMNVSTIYTLRLCSGFFF